MTTKEFNYAIHNLRDEAVFKRFYEEIYPQIFKISLSIFHNESICYDIAQDVFKNLFIYENLSYVKYPHTWLYTLCKNAGIKYLHNQDVELEENAPYTSFTELYDCGEVDYILRGLTIQERQIIELHYLVGFLLKEIAQMQNRTYAAVAKQHKRILKQLERKMSQKS
ncbi:MAG: sigma-70 family RNA polymerase sigma factor [Ruminococcus flavefaciens]|nr:sigma-70 family RNA polymerase sigma factor [Ruminococcus flavefaciens]